ncbi:hypothetical protein BDQ12DRAFT_672490 [Crucibulum laeve]|uniref:CCHC-type domain-containing protein n=1 Tax=Crucibulum laeve TaxID=68775 RepID=A0A5C3MJU7_9AGAR|nr:hypothetical protein BDQ12DRAFT_672490 [Crucibulum laeve]
MTRVTNIGRKRTYVQAGFSTDQPETQKSTTQQTANELKIQQNPESMEASAPPKKKRKRTPKSKRDGHAAEKAAAAAAAAGEVIVNEDNLVEKTVIAQGEAGPSTVEDASPPKLSKSAKKKIREREAKAKRLTATEMRRQKRINEKEANTTCFACREKGHAARDCPVAKATGAVGKDKGKSVVGICYRCGSTRHTLARCKKPVDPENPLPFASCFVCNGKGHLASSCPQNKSKGIYPDGGCCKLCGDNTHLAKDCGLRKNEVIDSTTVLGTGREAGPDEDDFHVIKRRTTEVERDEKQENKAKRLLDIKAGAYSGVVKAFTALDVKKKVVTF